MDTHAGPKPRRRLALSLRLMMGLVLAVGCVLGWWVRSTRIQRRAVDVLALDNQTVIYDYEMTDGFGRLSREANARLARTAWRERGGTIPPLVRGNTTTPLPKTNRLMDAIRGQLGRDSLHAVTQVWSPPVPRRPSQASLEAIADLPNLTLLHLNKTGIDDRDLARLGHLSHLKGLRLSQTRVTDAGLSTLARFPRLQELDLGDTFLTDAGLIHVAPLHDLEILSLCGTKVTDSGLEQLQGLTRIRNLDLSFTETTGACLDRLKPFTRLEILRLGCSLDAAGLKKLEMFPKLQYVTFFQGRESSEIDPNAFRMALRNLQQARPQLGIWYRNRDSYKNECIFSIDL